MEVIQAPHIEKIKQKRNSDKGSLVDAVEQKLIAYLKDNGLTCGSSLPCEHELAQQLGVARSVVREALSRFKMLGIISSKTKVGMILQEPSLLVGVQLTVNPMWMSDRALMDILELRCNMEIGCTEAIFNNLNPSYLTELERIVKSSTVTNGNKYDADKEYLFHAKLYEITGNKTIMEFQTLIHPVMNFVKENYKAFFAEADEKLKKEGKSVSHSDLLHYLQQNDKTGYREAIANHFRIYTDYIAQKRK